MAVYDCFIFFNEIDLLKMRLEIMNDVVDYFVIVECSKTTNNAAKPFYFEDNKHLFAEYANKIIHVKLDEEFEYSGQGDWCIEVFQRNSIIKGILKCKPDDLIVISDVDEIVNPLFLKNLNEYNVNKYEKRGIKTSVKQFIRLLSVNKKLVTSKKLLDFLEYYPVALDDDCYVFFMNYQRNINWRGSVICRYKNMQLPQRLRNQRNHLPWVTGHVGWHFTYLGGRGGKKETFSNCRRLYA